MIHENDEIFKAVKSLAQMVVDLEQQKHKGVVDSMLCHKFDVIAQQSRMLLKELDDENIGDA